MVTNRLNAAMLAIPRRMLYEFVLFTDSPLCSSGCPRAMFLVTFRFADTPSAPAFDRGEKLPIRNRVWRGMPPVPRSSQARTEP